MKKLGIVCSAAVFLAMGASSSAQHSTDQHVGDREIDQATEVMSRHTHTMGPHMKLSSLREENPADEERARKIVTAARQAIEKYQDPRAAEADNFRMFMPNLKNQKQYHFTNYGYALEAALHFDPEHPTSLLYEKDKKSGQLKLIGLMYTAPARFTEDELHERIPLSVSQWHQHVNLCVPPRDQRGEMFRPNARFGLMGSIATKEACEQGGGTFRPRIFGWMVHMYPFEKTPEAIWSVERQKNFMDTPHQH
jgi:hypothetical protein